MEKVQETIHKAVFDWLGDNQFSIPSIYANQLVKTLFVRLSQLCTDLTPHEDYKEYCAYCGRKAKTHYG